MPRVSVVTASYNHRPFLEDRIDSLLRQTFRDFEWIVVDDGSRDGSQQVLAGLEQRDPRIRVVLRDVNEGMAETTNEAIELTSGELIHRAESDDVLDPRFLETMVRVFDDHPGVGLAYCKTLRLGPEGSVSGGRRQPRRRRVRSCREAFQRLLLGNHIGGPSVVFSRAAYRRAGPFGMSPVEVACDWHFALRVAMWFDVAYTPEPFAFHRTHSGNLSGELGRTLDVEAFVRESYDLVRDVMGRLPAHLEDLGRLEPAAIRRISHGNGAGLYVEARRRGRRDVAREIRARIEAEDPGATTGIGWAAACARAMVEKPALRLLSRVVPGRPA